MSTVLDVVAVATGVIALLFSGTAVSMSYRTRREEQARQMSEQAKRVAAWVWERPRHQLYVLNASDLPVFDVQISDGTTVINSTDILPTD